MGVGSSTLIAALSEVYRGAVGGKLSFLVQVGGTLTVQTVGLSLVNGELVIDELPGLALDTLTTGAITAGVVSLLGIQGAAVVGVAFGVSTL